MEDEDNREAFFDQLDEEDDVMPGVPEAEEEGASKKKSDEPKKVKITKAGKPRFNLNESVLTGKNGLGTVLNHFKVNFSLWWTWKLFFKISGCQILRCQKF